MKAGTVVKVRAEGFPGAVNSGGYLAEVMGPDLIASILIAAMGGTKEDADHYLSFKMLEGPGEGKVWCGSASMVSEVQTVN